MVANRAFSWLIFRGLPGEKDTLAEDKYPIIIFRAWLTSIPISLLFVGWTYKYHEPLLPLMTSLVIVITLFEYLITMTTMGRSDHFLSFVHLTVYSCCCLFSIHPLLLFPFIYDNIYLVTLLAGASIIWFIVTDLIAFLVIYPLFLLITTLLFLFSLEAVPTTLVRALIGGTFLSQLIIR